MGREESEDLDGAKEHELPWLPFPISPMGGSWGSAGIIATPVGPTPTSTVSTTVLSEVLITSTLSDNWLATKTRPPSGVTATPIG